MPSMYVVVDSLSTQQREYLSGLFQYYNKDPYAIVNDLNIFCNNNQEYRTSNGLPPSSPPPQQQQQQQDALAPLETVRATNAGTSSGLSCGNYAEGYFSNNYSNCLSNNYLENSPYAYGANDMSNLYYGFNNMPNNQIYNSTMAVSPTSNYNASEQYSPNMPYTTTTTAGNMSRHSDEGFFSESSFASCSTTPNTNSSCNSSPSDCFTPDNVCSEEKTKKSSAGSKFVLWAVLCDAFMNPQYSGSIRIYGQNLEKISFVIDDMNQLTNILSNYTASSKLKGRISTYLWNAVQRGLLKKIKRNKNVAYVLTESAIECLSHFLEKKNLSLDDFFSKVTSSSQLQQDIMEEDEDEDDDQTTRKRGKAGLIWNIIIDCLLDPLNHTIGFYGGEGNKFGFCIRSVEALSDQLFGCRGLTRGEKTRKLRILLWNGTNIQKYIERVNGSLSNYHFTTRSFKVLSKILTARDLKVEDLRKMCLESCSRHQLMY